MLLKKSISYFMNIMYKHIFLNFGVISFINKEMVSIFQLHTYKFGLVYISISSGFVSSNIYDKRDDFDIVNFPFLDGDVPRRTSYGVYI